MGVDTVVRCHCLRGRSSTFMCFPSQIQYKNFDISRAKVQCLKNGEWLNDEAINFYMSLLQV